MTDLTLSNMPRRRRATAWLLTSSGSDDKMLCFGAIDGVDHLPISNRFRKGEPFDQAIQILFGTIELAAKLDEHDYSYSPEGGVFIVQGEGTDLRGKATAPRPYTDAEFARLSAAGNVGDTSVTLLQTADGRNVAFVMPVSQPDSSIESFIKARFLGDVRYSIHSAGGLTLAPGPVLGRELPIITEG